MTVRLERAHEIKGKARQVQARAGNENRRANKGRRSSTVRCGKRLYHSGGSKPRSVQVCESCVSSFSVDASRCRSRSLLSRLPPPLDTRKRNAGQCDAPHKATAAPLGIEQQPRGKEERKRGERHSTTRSSPRRVVGPVRTTASAMSPVDTMSAGHSYELATGFRAAPLVQKVAHTGTKFKWGI